VNTDLARFLATRTPLTEEQAVWGGGESAPRLRFSISAYLDDQRPPPSYVTSVRGLIFRGDLVLVVRNRLVTHIWPGGRREVLEETGCRIAMAAQLGFLHFHHLSPKPPSYAYPYPDFMQLVYVAEARAFVSEARHLDDYELEAVFRPVAEVTRLS